MIFLDAYVFIYQVGRSHPLQELSRARVAEAMTRGDRLVTSAEVLQELLHFYRRSRRDERMEKAFSLVARTVRDIWALEEEDIRLARNLAERNPGLEARDLVHLASCLRRDAEELCTFDRALEAAWARAR